MDWDNVRIFLSVARTGQFLAAGRLLGIDHATVARRVSALENALGSSLFERRTTGCTITSQGERFLVAAERIEAEMLSAQADVSATGVNAAGTVRIGAPDGFGTIFLTPRLGRLTDQYPALTPQLVPVPRAFSLSRREADIAITIDRPESGRLAIRKLTDYTLHLYASPEYIAQQGAPASAAELVRHRHITYVQDLLFSPELNFMPELFAPGYRRFECASAMGQYAAVESGMGIGILHDYHARNNPGLVRILPDITFARSYWIVTHLDSQNSLRIRAAADFIAAEVTASRHIFQS